MSRNRSGKRKKSKEDVVGGQWLPNLLTWGGVILMITGGVIAYPTLQDQLVPPDPQNLEFSVTAAPPPAQAVLQPTATPGPEQSESAPPPVILPETELITPQNKSQPQPTATPASTEAPEAPTATPTPPPSPTPTVDPASLVPNRLIIPAIDLDAPIVQVGWETQKVNGQLVSNWIVPDSFAAGWHKTSALLGEAGNTVLNGHHNIHGEVFRDLVDLQPGDLITLYAGDTVYNYSVVERQILEEKGQPVEVRIENAQWIMPTEDERLTLVTCWPYTNNTHRLVIVGVPAEPTPTPSQTAK